MKKGPYLTNIVLSLLLILAVIFKEKVIYIAPTLNVSMLTFIYSFTFLIPIILINKYNFKSAKQAITYSFMALIIFYLITTLLCTIPGNMEFLEVEDLLRKVFAPNSFSLGNMIIYYPDLTIPLLGIVYLLSHNILISTYEALTSFTNKYLSFSIAIFIAFIIDTMFSVPFIYFQEIFYNNIDMLDVIKYLTASYMVLIVFSLIMIFIYSLYINKKDKKD